MGKKAKDITFYTRKIGKNYFSGLRRYGNKETAQKFANYLRKGRNLKTRIIPMKSHPKYALFVDGFKEG